MPMKSQEVFVDEIKPEEPVPCRGLRTPAKMCHGTAIARNNAVPESSRNSRQRRHSPVTSK